MRHDQRVQLRKTSARCCSTIGRSSLVELRGNPVHDFTVTTRRSKITQPCVTGTHIPTIPSTFDFILAKMEEDRAQAELGGAVDAELEAEKQEKQRQPRKRFIGRKEAAERAEKRGDTNGTIEDSGVIQGVQKASEVCERVSDVSQLHNQERRPDRSTKFLQKSSMIRISTMPYHFYLQTTLSRYTRQYIEYAHLVPRR